MNQQLAIVILNYNGQALLAEFLPNVLATANGAAVYLADNASTDGSVTFVRASFPAVTVLELPQNTGYAGGYNAALEQLRHGSSPPRYYCLLNSDVAVAPGWLEPVLALLEANPRAAACQPKILAHRQPGYFEYAGGAGGYLDWLGYAFCRGRLFDTLEKDTGQYDDDRRVFWASGACLFVRAAVFHESGGFEAAFFAHMEEIDWCWRVQRQGHEIWTCGGAQVAHVGAGTLAKTNPRKTYLNYRNSLWMLYRNLPPGSLWPLLLWRLVLDGLSAGPLLLRGNWAAIGAVVRAHGAFWGRLGTLRRQRRALAQTATHPVGLFPKSIVWQYFVRGVRQFSNL